MHTVLGRIEARTGLKRCYCTSLFTIYELYVFPIDRVFQVGCNTYHWNLHWTLRLWGNSISFGQETMAKIAWILKVGIYIITPMRSTSTLGVFYSTPMIYMHMWGFLWLVGTSACFVARGRVRCANDRNRCASMWALLRMCVGSCSTLRISLESQNSA